MTSQPGQQTIKIHILPNISRRKDNKTIKFGQLIKYNKKNVSLEIMQRMWQGDQFQTFLLFKRASYEVNASRVQLSSNLIRKFSTWNTIKINCIIFQINDPEICSTFIFQKRIWKQLLHHILRMNFQEKCFCCYILLTDIRQYMLCNYQFPRLWRHEF